MVCYRRDDKSSRPNKKNRRHLSGQSRGYHQDQGQVNCHNDITYTLDHHGGIPRSPASSAPVPVPQMRFGTAHNPGGNTHARQPCTFCTGDRQLGGGTAPSTTLSGTPLLASEDARVPVASRSSNAAQIAYVKSPRAPTPSADDSHGVVPPAGTSASSVAPPQPGIFFFLLFFFFDGKNARFQRRSPRPWSELGDGNRASSAISLSRGINSAMGVCAPNAAPINHGTGACALRAPPQACVTQQYSCGDDASPFFARTCSPPPLPDQAVTVGLRCGTVDPQTDHEVAVDLRCGEANTKTPRSFARLDPVFARDNSGRSVLLSIKEKSTR